MNDNNIQKSKETNIPLLKKTSKNFFTKVIKMGTINSQVKY